MICFERRTFLPISCEAAFDLSLSIDAHLGAFRRSGERAVAGVTAGVIGHGEFVTWRARLFGVTWTMTNAITEWDRPHRFVDEQARGPFRSFRHEHVLTAVDGGTELHDLVRFEAPFGALGVVAERVVLGRYLSHLIDVRNEFLVTEAERRSGRSSTFEFAADPALRRWSRLFGVRAEECTVTLSGERLTITFGRWALRTTPSNVADIAVTGPYRWWKVAGPPRLSLADRGVTFATTNRRGVCVRFRRPVRAIDPFGLIRHPAATLTVVDPERLAAGLATRVEPQGDHVPAGSSPAGPGLSRFKETAKALVRWARRDRSVDVAERSVADGCSVAQPSGGGPDAQPIHAGVGPEFHRRYRVFVEGSALSAAAAMARLQADPNTIAPQGLAPFEKVVGDVGAMLVGDRFVVELAGPWTGPVEVADATETTFRLVTLDGHMEAGFIDFSVTETDGDLLQFTIESRARSGDHAMHVLYDHLGVAKNLQSEMWVETCERFPAVVSGRQHGPVDILTERVEGRR